MKTSLTPNRFSVTFLGHQGWLFTTARTSVLIDPLLVEEMGHDGGLGRVYPPRRIDFDHFPALDAVVFTHEHEDHFNIPSLNRIDRAVPIWISGRSSAAARCILAEMGFRFHLFEAGDCVQIGDLEAYFFAPEALDDSFAEEWDLLHFFLRSVDGAGSFFSVVDAPASEETENAIRALAPRPGLYCHTNNSTTWSFMEGGAVEELLPINTLALLSEAATEQNKLRFGWEKPAGTLFCGGGFSFTGNREQLNHRVFHADSRRVCAALRAIIPDELFLAPNPGQTVHMSKGRVVGVDDETPFLRAAPEAEWPSREYEAGPALMQEYAPATGRRDLSPSDFAELVVVLKEYARYLYARRQFRMIHSFGARRVQARKPTFAIVVFTDDDMSRRVLEYSPQACAFVPVDCADPTDEYVSGLECWGSDLLALFRGELTPSALVFGRARFWNFAPQRMYHVLDLWMYFHPLQQPEMFTRIYRRLWSDEPARVPVIRKNDRARGAKERSTRRGNSEKRIAPQAR
jgi:hypothetical protein